MNTTTSIKTTFYKTWACSTSVIIPRNQHITMSYPKRAHCKNSQILRVVTHRTKRPHEAWMWTCSKILTGNRKQLQWGCPMCRTTPLWTIFTTNTCKALCREAHLATQRQIKGMIHQIRPVVKECNANSNSISQQSTGEATLSNDTPKKAVSALLETGND